MSARQVLSAEEYQNIERRIDSYILRISNNEADAALREESIEKLERYLEKFHHYGSGFKNWLYSKMNGAVTTKANEDLTDLWTAYQAASVTAKMAGVKNTYNEERASRAAAGPINFNMLLTNDGHSAPQTGNYDHSYMTRGRPVYSANTQPHNGSPASGVFEYNSSGHNSVASSYHSQQGPLYYKSVITFAPLYTISCSF
ncbi:hypothetical protein C8R46DRAFT_1057650 [Mycena filopes]|nr:hypothetical protein C8R46DRAFT_1057650 [Mycena filopes]